MKQHHAHPSLAWLAFAILFSLCDAHAEESITGTQFKRATLSSIDVLSSHLILLQAQSECDQMLSNISYTIQFAPAKLHMSNGTVHDGSFVRSLLPMSVGLGNVSEFGSFIGFQGDYVKVFDLKVRAVDEYTGEKTRGLSFETSQIIVFAGIAALGFQVDAGIMGGVGFELDKNNDFPLEQHEIVKDDSALSEKPRYVFSLYHRSGIFLSTLFDMDSASGATGLSDFRFNFQPLTRFLPDYYGLPFIDLLGTKTLSGFIGDHNVSGSSPTGTVSAADRRYDFSVGADNFVVQGLRPALSLQLIPSLSFSRFEAAYVENWFDGFVLMGARPSLFSMDGEFGFSFDSFLSIGGDDGAVGLSYSYNSPNNTTFIPLPNMHVFGLQFVYGNRATAKPIIPFALSLREE